MVNNKLADSCKTAAYTRKMEDCSLQPDNRKALTRNKLVVYSLVGSYKMVARSCSSAECKKAHST